MTAFLALVRKYWMSITLFILVVISVLSLLPLKEFPAAPGTDKAHHLIAYSVLIFPTAIRKPKHWLLIILFFIAWSGGIELIQPYVNRYGEWQDMLANIAGLGCGFGLATLLEWFFSVDMKAK